MSTSRRQAGTRWAVACLLAATTLVTPTTVIGAEAPSADTLGRTSSTPSNRLADVDLAIEQQVEDVLARMSLRQKVGQLFVTKVYGSRVDDDDPAVVAANNKYLGVDNARDLIETYHVGGVVYFQWTRSFRNPQQTARLSNGIQRVAMAQDPAIPLLISTDQEQGIIVRMPPPATQLAGSMALGATRSSSLARAAARVTGEELAAVGILQDLAPVADVNVNPENPVIGMRSFGANPSLVSRLTAAQVKGFQDDVGVSATAKHFPGHGDTTVDSHNGMPVIRHSRTQWERLDAPPFQAAIDAGVDIIMTAHIAVPSLDPSGVPATLSKPILTDILRGEMGFEGVIMTDSLGMGGVRDAWTNEEIPVLALKAGADLLANPPRLRKAYNAVLAAVRSGDISEARIDASVRRILTLKLRRGSFDSPTVSVSRVADVVGSPGHRSVARDIAEASMTLVKNGDDLLPRRVDGRSVLVTGYGQSAIADVASGLRSQGASVRERWTGAAPSDSAIAAAVSASAGRDLIIVLTRDVRGDVRQRTLVKRLLATGRRVVTVAIGQPWDIAWYPTSRTHLVTFSMTDASMRALPRVITGKVQPTGRLPVSIPRAGQPNVTLYPYGRGLHY